MILDTCALLWLAEGGSQLSKIVRERIRERPVVYISSVTGFEICLKHRSGKLVLPVQPSEWINFVLQHHNIDVIPLSLDVCVEAANLPPVHKDPCDRFIIATAKINDLPVVTAGLRFKQYGIEVVF